MSGARHPFGSPDGAQADFQEFVQFKGASFNGISTRDADRTARIFVGSKGAGKTVYLRHQQAAAAAEESLYADHVQADFPPTSEVVRFSEAFADDRIRISQWTRVWKIAVLRSLVSHLANANQLRRYASEGIQRVISPEYREIFPRVPGTPLSVYSQVAEILTYGDPKSARFERYISNPLWAEVEHHVASALEAAPPVCFFLDSLDNEYHLAPAYWLSCQQGLFEQVLRFLRDSQLSSRLHIAIGVRDVVYSAMLRGEHANRVRGQPHVRILNWNRSALKRFLQEKVIRLDSTEVLRPGDQRSVEAWLGVKSVRNGIFEVDEGVEEYLLRHTRFIPRDLVILGNALCAEVAVARDARQDHLSGDVIRRTVQRMARSFGEEQLSIAANQVRSDITISTGATGYASELLEDDSESQRIEAVIRELLRRRLSLRFTNRQLLAFRKTAREKFKGATDLASVLWQNGLLGYAPDGSEGEEYIFYNPGTSDRFHLGIHRPKYCLHPCLVDAIDGLGVTGDVPVTPVLDWSS